MSAASDLDGTVAPTPAPPSHARRTDEAIARHGRLGRAWVAGLWQGDPLADAFVADMAELGRPTGMRMLSTALADGVEAVADAPDSLRALFAQLDEVPAWVDHDQLDRAGDHVVRNIASYGVVLAAASLMIGYTNPAAAKPLVLTGRLVQHAGVRNLEVGDWFREVTTPGGMRRHGAGFERTVRVRLIHAMVRHHLDRHPEWDPEVLGRPISQPYMAHTLSEFGSIAIRGVEVLGAHHTDADRADLDALWRYVGWVSGVDPALLPSSAAEQEAIEDLYQLTRPPVDDDSRALVQGLVDDYLVPEVANLLPGVVPARHALSAAYVRGIIRAVIGHGLADELGIASSRLAGPLRLVGGVTRATVGTAERLPGVRAARAAHGRRYQRVQEARLREQYGMTHDLVDTSPAADHPARA